MGMSIGQMMARLDQDELVEALQFAVSSLPAEKWMAAVVDDSHNSIELDELAGMAQQRIADIAEAAGMEIPVCHECRQLLLGKEFLVDDLGGEE